MDYFNANNACEELDKLLQANDGLMNAFGRLGVPYEIGGLDVVGKSICPMLQVQSQLASSYSPVP